jgi:hypothetical protein
VTEIVLLFPEAWERFRAGALDSQGDPVPAYASLMEDPDLAVRERAARAWCAWEDTVVSPWPGSELIVLEQAGHGATDETRSHLLASLGRFS